MSTPLHFGRLRDGTEASISDLVMDEHVVVSVLDLDQSQTPRESESRWLHAAQAVRRTFPELNRSETPSALLAPVPFERRLLSEEEARGAVCVSFFRHDSEAERDASVQQKVLDALRGHPLELGPLCWKLNVHFGPQTVSQVLFIGHSFADGVGAHRVSAALLEHVLQGDCSLEQDRYDLYGALPPDRIHFSFFEVIKAFFLALLGAIFPRFVHKHSEELNAPSSRIGPMQMDFASLSAAETADLLAVCKRQKVRVGSLLAATQLEIVAKGAKKKLGLSVDMRRRFKPPLPPTVLAPQQGSIELHVDCNKYGTSLWSLAREVQRQVDAALVGSPNSLIASEITLSFMAWHFSNRVRKITYLDSDWLSNCGLLPLTAQSCKVVQRAWLINKPIIPAFRVVWATTVPHGPLTLSQISDSAMFDKQSKKDQAIVAQMVSNLREQILK